MNKPREITTLEDAWQAQQGELVSIAFEVPTSEESVNLKNIGVLECVDANYVLLVVPTLTAYGEKLGRLGYQWSEQRQRFSLDLRPNDYVDAGSPHYRAYARTLNMEASAYHG